MLQKQAEEGNGAAEALQATVDAQSEMTLNVTRSVALTIDPINPAGASADAVTYYPVNQYTVE